MRVRRVIITWRAFLSVFLIGLLAVPHSKHWIEGTPRFILSAERCLTMFYVRSFGKGGVDALR